LQAEKVTITLKSDFAFTILNGEKKNETSCTYTWFGYLVLLNTSPETFNKRDPIINRKTKTHKTHKDLNLFH
jgi:hypothetical protein